MTKYYCVFIFTFHLLKSIKQGWILEGGGLLFCLLEESIRTFSLRFKFTPPLARSWAPLPNPRTSSLFTTNKQADQLAYKVSVFPTYSLLFALLL